jgi:ankyrin repeat protein
MKKSLTFLFLVAATLYSATFSEAIEALKADNIEPMRTLIQTKDDANLCGDNNKTILMYSVWVGDMNTVELLIKQGANINAQDESGKTALMLALYKKYNDISLYLINQGADLELISDDNQTALSLVGVQNKDDLLKALKEE